nr:hypothetical protein RJW52_05035 [Streptococcus suis]
MATILKKLLINFQTGTIFSTENVVYTKIILGTLIVWTSIQFASAFFLSYLDLKNAHIVKSSATSSLITREPEVKLSGLAQTEISRIDIEEVVWGAH